MDNSSNTFNLKTGDQSQFRIEVVDGDRGRFFYISPLGDLRYEISDDAGAIGTIQLDRENHSQCKNLGCELDMPLLHSIREGIQFHESWSPRA